MSHTKKIILTLFGALFLFSQTAFAVTTTLLPEAGTEAVCEAIFQYGDPDLIQAEFQKDDADWQGLLGCAIKFGKVEFWMIPYFVNGILEFILGLAGLIAVLMIMIGAYYYIAGGLTEDKEKGKTIIKYALGGFILVLSAWILVNIILLAVTA